MLFTSYYYYWYPYNRAGAGGEIHEGNVVFRSGNEVVITDRNFDIANDFLQGIDIQDNYLLFNCIFSIDPTTLYFSPNKGDTFSPAPNLFATGLKSVYPLGRDIFVAGDDGFHKSQVDVWSWSDNATVLNINDLDFCAPNLLASSSDAAALVRSIDTGTTWFNSVIPASVTGCSSVTTTGGKVYSVVKSTDFPLIVGRLLVSTDNGVNYTFAANDNVVTDDQDFFGDVYEYPSGRILYANKLGIYVAESDSSPFFLKVSTQGNTIAKFNDRVYVNTVSDGIYYTDNQGVTFDNFLAVSSALSADDNCYVVSNPGNNLIIDDSGSNQFLVISNPDEVTFLTDDSGENILTDDSGVNKLTI